MGREMRYGWGGTIYIYIYLCFLGGMMRVNIYRSPLNMHHGSYPYVYVHVPAPAYVYVYVHVYVYV